jgi:hypothetical protein
VDILTPRPICVNLVITPHVGWVILSVAKDLFSVLRHCEKSLVGGFATALQTSERNDRTCSNVGIAARPPRC